MITAPSMRKALGLPKQHRPDAITAEFIYSPMYSARICNLESLFTALQSLQLNPQLIVFIDKENRHHLAKLAMRYHISRQITYPINGEKLANCLQEHAVIT